MGSILPPASLPAERRKASNETLDHWFTEPVSTTVGRLLRLSPVLSFRPTEIDLAATAVVQQRWDALDESLRQVLGKDYLRKTVEEEIAKVRQFIAALRDFGTGRSGLFAREVYARSLEAWGVQIMGSDDCSPVRSEDSQAVVSDTADEAAVEVPPPPAALAGSSAEAPAAEAPEVASGDQAPPTAAAQSSSDEETQTPALKQGSRTASSSDVAASVPALQQGTQPAATLPKLQQDAQLAAPVSVLPGAPSSDKKAPAQLKQGRAPWLSFWKITSEPVKRLRTATRQKVQQAPQPAAPVPALQQGTQPTGTTKRAVCEDSSDEEISAPGTQPTGGTKRAVCEDSSDDDDVATLLAAARRRLQATSWPALVTPPTRAPRSPFAPVNEATEQAQPTPAPTALATSSKRKRQTGSLSPTKKPTLAQTALDDVAGRHLDAEEWSCGGKFYPWYWDAGRWVWVGAPERQEENAQEPFPEALPKALPEKPRQKAVQKKD